jgi:O-methyltransferase/methyltransferase family protein
MKGQNEHQDLSPERAVIDIITGTWRAQALHAAVQLGIPDHISSGDTTSRRLAERTGATADALERLIRLLVALGVCTSECDDAGYSLTPLGELLRRDVQGSLYDLVLLYGDEFYRAWGSFASALVTGESGFRTAFGMGLRDYLSRDAKVNSRFQRAMQAGSVFFAEVPRRFDFSRCATVVDVAGGSGALLSAVLQASPGTRGLLLDLPHVVAAVQDQLGSSFEPGRLEVLAGDAFRSVPTGADVYLLARVLQDWDDGACLRLLSTCRAAMPDESSLLIVDRVIPDRTTVHAGRQLSLLWDLHLLTTAGGRHRTMSSYRDLLTRSGFDLQTVHSLPLEVDLLIAVPAKNDSSVP